MSDRPSLQAVLVRALLLGAELAVVSVAGAAVVLAEAATGTINAAVLMGTVLLGLAVGAWAGSPDAASERVALRERWLAAAAVTAVAGSFATFSFLYEQIYPGPWWRVAGLLIVVAAPAYVLGLLLPVLLIRSEAWLDRDDAEPTEWAALGPLVLGILTGAAVGTLVSALLILPRWSPGGLLMGMAVLLLAPILLGEPSGAPPNESTVFETVTPFGSLRVTDVVFPGERQPERRLYLNGEEESGQLVRSGAPTLAYIAAAESWLSQITPPGASYLLLGGGGYTLPRRLAERDPRAQLLVVELDPEVTRIAYQFFGVKGQHRITSIHGDARAYLDHDDLATFDRIYVDVYGGREALPHSMVTREAAASIARRLSPRGIAGVNLIGTVVGEESRQLWSIVRSFAEVFPTLELYSHLGPDFPERQNLLMGLTLEPGRQLPSAAGYFHHWRREEWPAVEGVIVYRDLAIPTEQRADATARQTR